MGLLCLSKYLQFISRSPRGCLACAHILPLCGIVFFPPSVINFQAGTLLSGFILSSRQMCYSWSLLPLLWPLHLGRLHEACLGHSTGLWADPFTLKGVSSPYLSLFGYLCHVSSQNCAEILGKGLSADCAFKKYLPSPVVFRQCNFDTSLSLLESG